MSSSSEIRSFTTRPTSVEEIINSARMNEQYINKWKTMASKGDPAPTSIPNSFLFFQGWTGEPYEQFRRLSKEQQNLWHQAWIEAKVIRDKIFEKEKKQDEDENENKNKKKRRKPNSSKDNVRKTMTGGRPVKHGRGPDKSPEQGESEEVIAGSSSSSSRFFFISPDATRHARRVQRRSARDADALSLDHDGGSMRLESVSYRDPNYPPPAPTIFEYSNDSREVIQDMEAVADEVTAAEWSAFISHDSADNAFRSLYEAHDEASSPTHGSHEARQ